MLGDFGALTRGCDAFVTMARSKGESHSRSSGIYLENRFILGYRCIWRQQRDGRRVGLAVREPLMRGVTKELKVMACPHGGDGFVNRCNKAIRFVLCVAVNGNLMFCTRLCSRVTRPLCALSADIGRTSRT